MQTSGASLALIHAGGEFHVDVLELHLAALRHLGSPLHPTAELLGFPYLYAHFFECAWA